VVNLSWLFDEIAEKRVFDNSISFGRHFLSQIRELQREAFPVTGRETWKQTLTKVFSAQHVKMPHF
jgi:hypothetical protein